MTAANPIDTCIGCGQTDDHPKHHSFVGDGTWVAWHNDCHSRAANCPHCSAVVESAGEVKGDELRAHIEANNPAGAVGAEES